MVHVLGLLVAGLVAGLGLLHVVWAVAPRRRAGPSAVIPEVEGCPAFSPSRPGTLAVAAALVTAALVVLGRLRVWDAPLPGWVGSAGTWGIAGVFLLRAVGDFRLMGFSKRVRGTRFARRDTRLFSPLCLTIAIALALVAKA